MNSALSYYWDMMLLVLVLALAVINLPVLTNEWDKDIAVRMEDKSALDSENSIYVDDVMKTGADLMMALSIVDSMIPYPRSIRINETPVIDLDNAWIANKTSNLISIYSSSGNWKLGTMLNYQITNVEFVNNGGDPYWQYTLEEVTP